MNIRAFLLDSAYQIVTWVCIAGCFVGISYCWGKRNWKWLVLWSIGLCLSIVAMLELLAYQHRHKPPPIQVPQPEKQYAVIKSERIDEFVAGKSPLVTFTIENGPGEAVLTVSNITFRLTPFIPERYLKYNNDTMPRTTNMGPHQTFTLQFFPPDGRTLTQGEIDDLNADPPVAELYLYARVSYSNGSGTYPLGICRRYNKNFPNHLVFCEDLIKIE